MRNPYFNDVLATMARLHDRKNHDYAEDGNPFSNFEYAAKNAGVTVQQVFDVLLGVKQARLQQLTAKDALYESIEDSLIDRAVYATLAVAYERFRAGGTGSPEDYTPGSEWDDYVYPPEMFGTYALPPEMAEKALFEHPLGAVYDRDAFTVTPIPVESAQEGGAAYEYDPRLRKFVVLTDPSLPVLTEKEFLDTYGWVPDPYPCVHGDPCECANPTEADIHEERVARAEFYDLGQVNTGSALAAALGEGL